MSSRHGTRPPFDDDDEQDEGPTAQSWVGPPSALTPASSEPSDGVLTEDDIDEAVPTLEHRLPAAKRGAPLPRFEGTNTLTLPRGFLSSGPEHAPPLVLPPLRLDQALPPAARPLPPPTPFRVLPPPPRTVPQRSSQPDDGESSFSLAPTPIRQLPSVPPPIPPALRARRASEAPRPKRQRSEPAPRPRPPLASVPPPSDATRPFPLQQPTGGRASRPPTEPDIELDPSLAIATTVARQSTASSPSSPGLDPAGTAEEPSPRPPAHLSAPPTAHLSAPPPPHLSAPPPAHLSAPPPALPSTPPRPRSERDTRPPAPRNRGRPADQTALAASMGVFAALIIGALILAVVVTLRSSSEDDPPTGPVIAARPLSPVTPATALLEQPEPSAPSGFVGCSLTRTVQRLASAVVPTVVPMGAKAPGLNRVALGYATGRNHAEGVIVNLDDLSVETRYSEELLRPVFRVTPLTDRAPVAFAVDHDHPSVQTVRTVPASPPLRVGVSFFGFVRVNENTEPTVIWPGSRNEAIGEPSFVTTDRDGYGVAFRSGRTSGDVFAGWLTPSGTADGDLVRIDAGPREVGAPAIGANDNNVVVVFPARGSGEPWRLRIASAPRGKVPRSSRPLEIWSGGEGDALAPSIVALPSGGWLLQWLEGTVNARRVVVRALDQKLEPVGLPLETASGPGIQDVPGVLVVRAGRALAVHLSATERSVGLWGAVLRCN